jgi:signal transduction histidine kinase
LELGNPQEARPQLTKISLYSREMVERMRDVVWAISPSNDSLENIIQRLKNYCAEVCIQEEVNVQFQLDDVFKKVTVLMNARKNIYLICEEAIHNAVSLSGCQNIELRFHASSSEIQVKISDDGGGFKQQKVSSGNGQINMQSRAKEIKGRLTIDSSTAGTSVLLSLSVPRIRI